MKQIVVGSLIAASLLTVTPLRVAAQTIDIGPGGPSIDLRSRRQRERDEDREEARREDRREEMREERREEFRREERRREFEDDGPPPPPRDRY